MRSIATVLLLVVPLYANATASEPDPALNCIILPDEQVDLGSPVPGVIEHIGVRRSDRVHKGQPIARLESSVEQATVALARARATSDAEIELRRVEHGYDAQHRDRLNALQARQAVSSQNMDDAQRATEAAQLRVRLAQDKRREAILDQRRADAMLARKTIVSPIDGVVVQLNNRVGEYVETRPVARIARLDPLRVEVIAPLSMFGSVHEGMQVAVGPETDPANERRATVSAVDAVADPGSGTFGIQLALPNPGLKLPAGIKCTARLLPDAAPTAPRATAAALSEPEAPTATTAERPQLCLAINASESEQQAQRIARAAQRLGGGAQINEVEVAQVIGYLVATAPQTLPGERRALTERIRAAGIADFALLPAGTHAGRISLGTYNGPRSAERRRAALAHQGIETVVLPRTRTQRVWQLEVRLPEQIDPDAALAELRREGAAAVTLADACAPLRTAAR